jgi:ADP-heptose:LPS heptosyltransferase
MRLLFITSTRVGDAVLSTGILNACIQRYPGLAVTIACGAPAAPLFAAVPNLEELIVLEKMGYARHWLTLWRRCVGRYWDMLIDLRNAPITYLLAAKRRRRIGWPDNSVHRVVRLAQVLGLEDDPPAPRLWISSAERRTAARLVPEGSPVLAVGPTANWVGKTWRAQCFAELIDRLTGPCGILPGARVAICGHSSERQTARPVLEAVPKHRRIDLVGNVGLLEIYACLERAALYVGNDSGLMHLAAAAGIPTLGLFGPSREELYAPWGPLTAAVRPPLSYEEVFSAYSDHRNTGTLMDALTVDRVEQAAAALWLRVQEAA